MSLLRLLKAGKSLVGLQDETARYRMGHPRSMPKFGSNKNPFQGKAERTAPASIPTPATPPAPAVAAPEPVVNATPGEVVELTVTPAATVPAKLEAAQTAAEGAANKSPGARPKSGFGFKTMFGGMTRPFLKRKAAKAPRRQPLKTPVQVELSLDCVKVIRNDLSDADLEVVRAKAPAARRAEKPEPPQAEMEQPGPSHPPPGRESAPRQMAETRET